MILSFTKYCICVEKLEEKYENPALMRDPHFCLVQLLYVVC